MKSEKHGRWWTMQDEAKGLWEKIKDIETRLSMIEGRRDHRHEVFISLVEMDRKAAELMGWVSHDCYTSGIRQTYWNERSADGMFRIVMSVDEWNPTRDLAQAERFLKAMADKSVIDGNLARVTMGYDPRDKEWHISVFGFDSSGGDLPPMMTRAGIYLSGTRCHV